MAKNYSTAKGQHVQKEMASGKTKQQANRSWSHGKNNPRQEWIKDHPRREYSGGDGYYKSDMPEMFEYAYAADDL